MKWVLGVLLLSNLSLADTLVGKGSVTVGKSEYPYDVTLVMNDDLDKKTTDITETLDMKDGKEAKIYSYRVNWQADYKTFSLTEKDVTIGGGYCRKVKDESAWCDYHLQTQVGPLHINMFYDGATKSLHRMGDLVTVDGVKFLADDLETKAK